MNKKHIILIFALFVGIYLNRNVLIYRPLLNFFTISTTQALVINEKDVLRGGDISGLFTYYYAFSVNGKSYKNPSYDEKYKIGDTVLVEYNKTFPFMNRIKE